MNKYQNQISPSKQPKYPHKKPAHLKKNYKTIHVAAGNDHARTGQAMIIAQVRHPGVPARDDRCRSL